VISRLNVMHSFLATDISVGDHIQRKLFGLTVDIDTVWATGIALVIVVLLGVMLRRSATAGVPGKLQLIWESGIGAVTKQIEGTIGPRGLAIVPLAATLFIFILVANMLEIFGVGSTYEAIGVPTSNVNLPMAMALFVIILVHIASVRARGPIGYVKHYLTQPFPIFLMPFNLFINLVEEIAKPITLALRLFGNMFSGGLMLALIAALGAWKFGSVPIGDVTTLLFAIIWKLFDVFLIGPIQAFIFSLLTILYFDTAMADVH